MIVFVDGDGTARDVAEAVGTDVLVLGVPAGIKMYSGVFGVTPRDTAAILREFIEGRTTLRIVNVLEANEEACRRGLLKLKPLESY